MQNAQRIALQAFADLSDNELSRAIEAECDRQRIDLYLQREDDRANRRRHKSRRSNRTEANSKSH